MLFEHETIHIKHLSIIKSSCYFFSELLFFVLSELSSSVSREFFRIVFLITVIVLSSLVSSLSISRSVLSLFSWGLEVLNMNGLTQDKVLHDFAQRFSTIKSCAVLQETIVHKCRCGDDFVIEINLELITVSLLNLSTKRFCNLDCIAVRPVLLFTSLMIDSSKSNSGLFFLEDLSQDKWADAHSSNGLLLSVEFLF